MGEERDSGRVPLLDGRQNVLEGFHDVVALRVAFRVEAEAERGQSDHVERGLERDGDQHISRREAREPKHLCLLQFEAEVVDAEL